MREMGASPKSAIPKERGHLARIAGSGQDARAPVLMVALQLSEMRLREMGHTGARASRPLRSLQPAGGTPALPWIASCGRVGGFTLIEVLVSLAVLSLLMVFLFALVSRVTSVWRGAADAIGQWQSARRGFETMTRQISQATLNTVWAYYDASGNLTTSDPKRYGRHSDLQFVSGPTSSIIPTVTNTVSQGVFFQAPLGRASNNSLRGLPNLLNVCGFYVQFNSSADFLPNTGIFARAKAKYRFRLMQINEPTEALSVYAQQGANNFAWITKPINNGAARPLAENIVALFLLPRFSRVDTSNGALLAPNYFYNSRNSTSFSSGALKGNTLHQLPPLIQVTMVAIDETSATRIEDGASMPNLIPAGKFQTATDFEADLKAFEKELTDRGLRYRTFSSLIAIRGAKWGGDEP